MRGTAIETAEATLREYTVGIIGSLGTETHRHHAGARATILDIIGMVFLQIAMAGIPVGGEEATTYRSATPCAPGGTTTGPTITLASPASTSCGVCLKHQT